MGALHGLKILDFSTLLPGPYATMVLADLGAEVLHVVRPGAYDLVTEWGRKVPGAEVTGPAAWLGRNKKSVYLDLKQPAAVEAVKRLVLDYDIVLEQFRPGVMERLGLGYETLRAVNPGLIYCAITGYGQTGPLRDRAGHDCNYLARSGMLEAAGRIDGGPSLYNFQIADVASGANNAVIGILAAAWHRAGTGEGQYIDISMADGVVPFHTMSGAAYFAGESAPRREREMLNGGGVYDLYETADGRYLSICSLEPKFYRALCQGLNRPEWLDGKAWQEKPEETKRALREQIRGKTLAEWLEVFEGLDACVEPVLSLAEAVADAHLNQRGMWPTVPFAHAEGVSIQQPGNPIRMSETPPEYRHAGYPDGWHSREVLEALGCDEGEILDITGGKV